MKSAALGSLQRLASRARRFLVPVWEAWHAEWGPPEPAVLSEWTCVRSSLFLARVLCASLDEPAAVVSGANGDGVCWDGRWRSHAWAVCGGAVVDVTADQFGGPEVFVGAETDARYRPGADEARRLPASERQVRAVDLIWRPWEESVEAVLQA